MSIEKKESMERTLERTAAGESIFRSTVTGDEYFEDSYGQFHEWKKTNHEHPSSPRAKANSGFGMFILLALVLGGGLGLWLEMSMPRPIYAISSIIIPAFFLVMPFVNVTVKKKPRIFNALLGISVFFFAVPKVEGFTGAANSSFAYLGAGIDALIAGAIGYGVYLVVRSIHK